MPIFIYRLLVSCALFMALTIPLTAQEAQTVYVFKMSAGPGLLVNGDTSFSAFTGGFHRPQFANLDVDLDGVEDLLVFDNIDDYLTVFLGNGDGDKPRFDHAPGYEMRLPKCYSWVRLADFDLDGKMDIFTANRIGGAMVYKNVTANGNLLFELYNDDIKHYDPDIDMRIG
jgi:hypothetical protein